jgi:hypothetical protein
MDGIREDNRTRGLLKARQEYQPLSPDVRIHKKSGTYTGQAAVVVVVAVMFPNAFSRTCITTHSFGLNERSMEVAVE